MIITATLMTVAAMDRRMMNLEKDFCWLKAIRLAINEDRFTIKSYSLSLRNKPNGRGLRLIKESFAGKVHN